MSEVHWPDGREVGPDGPCRQVPCRHTWSSTLWITRDGTARRRHYNPISKRWSWDSEPLAIAFDRHAERFGYHLEHWVSTQRAVALAWLHRAPDSANRIVEGVVDVELVGADPPRRREEGRLDFGWSVGEVVASIEDAANLPGETWKPLRWRCGLVPSKAGYQISSHGRLKNPRGRVTRGLFYNGDRYAAVKGCGLVNLTVAAGVRQNGVDLNQSLWLAAEALGTGRRPADVAMELMIQEATAWSYFTKVAPFFAADDLRRRVPPLVAADLWALLTSMRAEVVVGGSLKELMAAVQRRLKRRGAFQRSDFRFEQLRLARLAIVK